jgi:hypothetical protein
MENKQEQALNKWSVDDIVASRGIATRGQGVRHVGIFVGTRLAFCFSEIGLGIRLGPHGKNDELCGLLWGATPTKKNTIF